MCSLQLTAREANVVNEKVGCWTARLANKFSNRIYVNLLKKITSVCSSKIGDCVNTVINGNLGGTVKSKDWIILPKSSFSKSHKNRMQHTLALCHSSVSADWWSRG